MDHLAPSNVPVYETPEEQRAVWDRCADRGQPVLAVRDAARGYVVTYDLQHLDAALADDALQSLRDRVRSRRPYRTRTDAPRVPADPVSESESEGVGGIAGPVSGQLHAPTEQAARDLASHISGYVLDRSYWK